MQTTINAAALAPLPMSMLFGPQTRVTPAQLGYSLLDVINTAAFIAGAVIEARPDLADVAGRLEVAALDDLEDPQLLLAVSADGDTCLEWFEHVAGQLEHFTLTELVPHDVWTVAVLRAIDSADKASGWAAEVRKAQNDADRCAFA
jgi:hypothetical protein